MALDDLFKQLGKDESGTKRALPPVEKWHPALSGDIDIHIKADGSWWHEGAPFVRDKLVRLFASILKKEADEYFLVTPVEKWRIRVDDAPFVAQLMSVEGCGLNQQIQMVTNVGDGLVVNAQHPLLMGVDVQGDWVPYVEVRAGLRAKVSRNVYYQLADIALENGGKAGVYSCGSFYLLEAG